MQSLAANTAQAMHVLQTDAVRAKALKGQVVQTTPTTAAAAAVVIMLVVVVAMGSLGKRGMG